MVSTVPSVLTKELKGQITPQRTEVALRTVGIDPREAFTGNINTDADPWYSVCLSLSLSYSPPLFFRFLFFLLLLLLLFLLLLFLLETKSCLGSLALNSQKSCLHFPKYWNYTHKLPHLAICHLCLFLPLLGHGPWADAKDLRGGRAS